MVMKIGELLRVERNPKRGLLAVEWVAMGYLLLTLLLMAVLWATDDERQAMMNVRQMLTLRLCFVMTTLAAWAVYRLRPCRITVFLRVVMQMVFLSWWYPDTYEINRLLPNLDHLFATCEQVVFGCQPALLFAQQVPYGWFSELMCLGYVSYFPLMALVVAYYFVQRYQEFGMAAFVVLATFFSYYVIFDLLPVTGPQFYYPAVGTEQIATGVFPDLGNWFLTHQERMDAPGWADGFWYDMLEKAHDAGERPTAAFPSSHVGVTMVILLLSLHARSRWLVLIVLPLFVLMCFATVYILAHYAIDVIAGFVTGTLFYLIFRFVYRRFLLDSQSAFVNS